MEKKEVITELLKNGGTKVENLKIKNVTVTHLENYVRLGLTLDKPVKGYVTKDQGVTYEEGETNVIFVSVYSIGSLLKDDEDAAFAANRLIEQPEGMELILSRATIDIIQEPVSSGEEYKNPWSDNATATVFDHDTIINHVIRLELSKFGLKQIDKLADKLVDKLADRMV